jgi:hypothetical protein
VIECGIIVSVMMHTGITVSGESYLSIVSRKLSIFEQNHCADEPEWSSLALQRELLLARAFKTGSSIRFGVPERSGLRAVCRTGVPNLSDAYELRCLGALNVTPGESERTQSRISRESAWQHTSAAVRTAGKRRGFRDPGHDASLTEVIPKVADDTDFAAVLQSGHSADARILPRRQ